MNGPEESAGERATGDPTAPSSGDDATGRDPFTPWPGAAAVPLSETGEPQRGRRRWPALVLSVVVIAGVVAGIIVATRSAAPSPATRIRTAAAQTELARSTRFKLAIDISVSGTNQATITITGASDFAAKATEMQIRAAGLSDTVRLVNGVAYLQLPSGLVHLPGGAQWIAVTPSDVGGSSASPGSIGSGDPTQGLAFLGGLVGVPVVVGHEQLDNVGVTHYKIVVDLHALFAKVGSAASALSPAFAKGYEALASSNDLAHFPLDVWLDSQGRVRRFDQTLNTDANGAQVTELESMTFSSFGVPVAVAAPDPSLTVPFAQVKDQISALLSGQASS